MNYIDGTWTTPDKSFLPDNINTFYPMFSPSGSEIYFAKSIGEANTNLWVAEFSENKASEPHPLDSILILQKERLVMVNLETGCFILRLTEMINTNAAVTYFMLS